VAFVTRYSSVGLEEALGCESSFLLVFMDELASIVREETKAGGSRE
jgi:hypothetical protein